MRIFCDINVGSSDYPKRAADFYKLLYGRYFWNDSTKDKKREIKMRKSFRVTLDIPEGASVLEAREYVRDAVQIHAGSLRPPGGYDDSDEGDPMFQLNIKSIRVRPIADKAKLPPSQQESDKEAVLEYAYQNGLLGERIIMKTLKQYAEEHNQWLNEMGWNKTTPLEQLALIASEIGEAVNECRGEEPTDKLGSELADIILRTFGLAEQYNINIQTEIENKMAINKAKGNYKGRLK